MVSDRLCQDGSVGCARCSADTSAAWAREHVASTATTPTIFMA